MPNIDVIDPGFYTSIQDTGRVGYRSQGIPVSGPMDRHAFSKAQNAVGNDAHAALLECTLKGPQLLFGGLALVAICGAPTTILLNETHMPMNHPFLCDLGDYLQLGHCKTGVRVYLAIRGGIHSEKLLGSRSLYYPISPQGQLKKGDKLPFNLVCNPAEKKAATFSNSCCNSLLISDRIEVIPGPEWAMLSQQEKEIISKEAFTVGSNNRMGYHLHGPLPHNTFSLPSSCVLPGVIQLTPNGTLLVAMADAQVTGGYPRVLVLSEESCSVLAQKRTGQKLQFHIV